MKKDKPNLYYIILFINIGFSLKKVIIILF